MAQCSPKYPIVLISLFIKVAILEGRVLSTANQGNKKLSKKPLIGWKKAGLPKMPLCFWTCK